MTVVSILLAVVALAVAALALRRADVVERRARQWSEAADASPAATTPAEPAPTSAAVPRPVPSAGGALNRVGVVRYDAFDDAGGRMSFSAALLDDSGRGVVLTAIHGRTETRSYLKQVPVAADSGQRDLSPEENQAVTEAMKATS